MFLTVEPVQYHYGESISLADNATTDEDRYISLSENVSLSDNVSNSGTSTVSLGESISH